MTEDYWGKKRGGGKEKGGKKENARLTSPLFG